MTLHKAAIIAGVALVLITLLSVGAEMLIMQKLIIPGDPMSTMKNIAEQEALFRGGIIGYLAIIITDVIVAWALYVLLKPVNQYLSLLAGGLRALYAVIFTACLTNLVGVSALLHSPQMVWSEPIAYRVIMLIDMFRDGWSMAYIFFGLHLILVGYLAFESGYMPKYLGVILAVAGLGYLVDSVGKIVSSRYAFHIGTYTFVGELVLMFWLLASDKKQNERLRAAELRRADTGQG